MSENESENENENEKNENENKNKNKQRPAGLLSRGRVLIGPSVRALMDNDEVGG